MNENIDEWNDDDFGFEYIKFEKASISDTALYDGNSEVLYIKPLYETIQSYTNQWNKRRKRVNAYKVVLAEGTPFESDTIQNELNLILDMGARLYNAMRICNEHKWKCVKIMKISNPNDKFDVQYYASEYQLKLQKKIPANKKSKPKSK